MAAGNTRSRKSPAKTSRRSVAADDILRLRFLSDPQISPDGTQVLFARKQVGDKNDYVTNLWIVPNKKGQPRQYTSGGKDGHGRWSPDGDTIAFISGRDEANPQIYTMSAAGGEATPLTSFEEGTVSSFQWSPDGSMLAVSFRAAEPEWTKAAKKEREETGGSIPARVIDDMYYRLDGDGYFNGQRFHLFLVDVETGTHRLLFDRDTIGWFEFDWSPDSSELVVAANIDPDALLKWWKADLFRVSVKTSKARKVPNLPVGVKSAVRWSPDGKRLAYVGYEGKKPIWGVHNAHVYVCNLDGSNRRDLTGGEDYCVEAITISDSAEPSFGADLIWSADGKRILMNLASNGETHVSSVDLNGGKIVHHTKGRQTVVMGNSAADGSTLALTVSTATQPPEIAAGTFRKPDAPKSLSVKTLTQENGALFEELDVPAAEPHWVTSVGGSKVHLWVLKPPGFNPKKKYPAVLQVHGGPHCQYGETFFHEFQVLASAGYVVVYSNPRGSKGYGEEHATAIAGKWGAADWEDVQAVTAFMQQQPFVRSSRIGIMGGSYGGYMTNWAIGHTNDFAAAVTDRCVSNLISMVGSSDLPLVPGEYWQGNSWDDTEEIWEQSPLKHFGNVTTPTLVIHSEGDLRCNVEQSEQVFAALKLRGIPTRFVRYPHTTSHGMSRMGPPDLRLHRLGQILDWWKQYLR